MLLCLNIKTPLSVDILGSFRFIRKAMAAQIPIGGKLGEPKKDLVPLLVFLAGEGAHFISGQSFPVDGGWLHMR